MLKTVNAAFFTNYSYADFEESRLWIRGLRRHLFYLFIPKGILKQSKGMCRCNVYRISMFNKTLPPPPRESEEAWCSLNNVCCTLIQGIMCLHPYGWLR